MNTLTIRGRIRPSDIAFLNATLGCFEDVAIVRTNDRKAGLVEFWVSPNYLEEFKRLIDDLSSEIDITLEM